MVKNHERNGLTIMMRLLFICLVISSINVSYTRATQLSITLKDVQKQVNSTKDQSLKSVILNANNKSLSISQSNSTKSIKESHPPKAENVQSNVQETFIPATPAVFLDDTDIALEQQNKTVANPETKPVQEVQVADKPAQEAQAQEPAQKQKQESVHIAAYKGSREKTGKKSPLQLPDEIVDDDEQQQPSEPSDKQNNKDETQDSIAKASDSDIGAYSVALNNGGAQQVIDLLTPTVKPEEDSGSMALFMGDVSSLAENQLGDSKQSSQSEGQDSSATTNTEEDGAAFAAQFAMDQEKKEDE